MSKKFLVIIDTTNRPSAKGFSKGIQNIYFVYANDDIMAKNMVLQTFRARPELLRQLEPCVRATNVDDILKHLSQRENSWSYIPIGGTRLPGQQVNVPLANPEDPNYQRMADKDYSPPKPITYSGQNDTVIDPRTVGPMNEKDAKLLNSQPAQTTNVQSPIPGVNLNDPNVQNLLRALLGQVAQPAATAVPSTYVPPPTLKQNELDDETLSRIRSNIKPSLETVDDGMDSGEPPAGSAQVDPWGEPIAP